MCAFLCVPLCGCADVSFPAISVVPRQMDDTDIVGKQLLSLSSCFFFFLTVFFEIPELIFCLFSI